jgi:hypothetical protein
VHASMRVFPRSVWVRVLCESALIASRRLRHCNVEYRKGLGFCEVGPTTQHEFDVVWKDLDFKIKVRCNVHVGPQPLSAFAWMLVSGGRCAGHATSG